MPPRRRTATAPSSASSAAIIARVSDELAGIAVAFVGGGGAGGSHSFTNVQTIAVSLSDTVSTDPASAFALPAHEKLFRYVPPDPVIVPSPSVATSPAYTVTTAPPSVSLFVPATAFSATPALFTIPSAVTVTASPILALIQVLRSCSVAVFRVFVYVQTTSLSGIVNVVAGPGVDDEGVAPVHATVVV